MSDQPAHRSEYVACGEVNHFFEVRCIKEAGHNGQHRGIQMIPKAVWWEDAKVQRLIDGTASDE